MVSNKMAESMPFATGTAANFYGKSCSRVRKWKQNFEIYLKAIGASKKPDEMKVGLLLNHIGEPCLKIYSDFTYLTEPATTREKKTNFQPKIPTTTRPLWQVQKRNPQLMLQEKF